MFNNMLVRIKWSFRPELNKILIKNCLPNEYKIFINTWKDVNAELYMLLTLKISDKTEYK